MSTILINDVLRLMGEFNNSNGFMHILICYPKQPEFYSIHQDHNLEQCIKVLKKLDALVISHKLYNLRNCNFTIHFYSEGSTLTLQQCKYMAVILKFHSLQQRS